LKNKILILLLFLTCLSFLSFTQAQTGDGWDDGDGWTDGEPTPTPTPTTTPIPTTTPTPTSSAHGAANTTFNAAYNAITIIGVALIVSAAALIISALRMEETDPTIIVAGIGLIIAAAILLIVSAVIVGSFEVAVNL
jgi:hypothetical protein